MENYDKLHTLLTIKPLLHRWNALYNYFIQLISEQMENENVIGYTHFSQISYLSQKYQWSRALKDSAHQFRKRFKSMNPDTEPDSNDESLAIFLLCHLIQWQSKIPIPEDLKSRMGDLPQKKEKAHDKYLTDTRVSILKAINDDTYLGSSEREDGTEFAIHTKYLSQDDIKSLRQIVNITTALPLIVHLHNIHIDNDIWYPKMVVIQPDYLIDITSISECFKPEGTIAEFYLLRKLYSGPKTSHLLIGNIANFFLDEIIKNPDISLKELMPKIFQLFPLDWIKYEDEELREIIKNTTLHFNHLQSTVKQEFKELEIQLKNIFLEPSFYSNKFGIQGRLDIFYRDSDKSNAKIIELKSGSAFKPNAYGLSKNHYAQTLLYDMLIKSVFKGSKPLNYILYSKLADNRLKHAPVLVEEQRKAMRIRNKIISMELQLSELDENEEEDIFRALDPKTFPIQYGFVYRDIKTYYKVYDEATPLDLAYYKTFVRFIAREQMGSKLGTGGINHHKGIASLWLDTISEKQNQYEIITGLAFDTLLSEEETPIIRMKRISETDQLANFRIGDIAVLYPYNNGKTSVLKNQVFKCTLLDLNRQSVTLRFRSSQLLLAYLKKEKQWILEHDTLDSGYNHLYKSLYKFMSMKSDFRRLIYGIKEPLHTPETHSFEDNPIIQKLDTHQQKIMMDMIQSRDYFLLWGPPGTGKTSIMLKSMVQYLVEYSEENILLLAYTNRAVDEISAALNDIELGESYIRIGSRYAIPDMYQHRLLNTLCREKTKRSELLQALRKHRIYVSTVASIQGKTELLETITFDTVIIDEASQIIEPGLVGLLSYFKRFILIGDHHQLPAVVRQQGHKASTGNALLNEIGLSKLHNSLFERLITTCRSKGWKHAYGQLTHQGRMHEEIMQLAAQLFYDNELFVVPDMDRLVAPLQVKETPRNELQKMLFTKRCLFVPTLVDAQSVTGKTNRNEAEKVVEIIRLLVPNAKKESETNIGVITPYRAQIALIIHLLEQADLQIPNLTIDTVERYQGSARDIIILSLCTNRKAQLKMIGQQAHDAINKKFNVALTRSKEQIIVLGNSKILKEDVSYKAYIAYAYHMEILNPV